MEVSNLKLKSNLMLEKKAKGSNLQKYMPAPVLVCVYPQYRDKRVRQFLTTEQCLELDRLLFMDREIIDEQNFEKCMLIKEICSVALIPRINKYKFVEQSLDRANSRLQRTTLIDNKSTSSAKIVQLILYTSIVDRAGETMIMLVTIT